VFQGLLGALRRDREMKILGGAEMVFEMGIDQFDHFLRYRVRFDPERGGRG